MPNPYLILAVSICAETLATTMMKASAGFTRLIPSIIVIIGYAVSFYGLSQVVKTMNIGIAYAIWAGMGIFLVSIMSFFVYKQRLDFPAIAGMLFIAAGIMIIQLFSKSVTH
ncbi:TPA: SMR family transporter [Klebsiella pneumoniae]|uniref:Multidrug DMT transporter n=1 Tax=Citrobacter sedlakii TaxID=67826 RepID=A0ABS0ZWA8_9ENTR|nr:MULTISPECIES: SMR family transporter [Enterobacteriaceae]EKU9431159.1 multidrug DMT transporter [Klebsiella variicola]MBZ6673516.1 multidrug DMT transporter [Klebsiella pneumoniae]HAJ0746639.1 multidrug DMT transporter [Escherichia coli]MBJ8383103.1 multidrug DMT transporter [Citrobacter sedlakii]MBZ7248855.1 multidrug DMT transporter [Klebsiella pneumoniae]